MHKERKYSGFVKTGDMKSAKKILSSPNDGRTAPGHFDPDVLATFVEIAPQFEDIFITNQD